MGYDVGLMERPELPGAVRAALPPIAQAYIAALESALTALGGELTALGGDVAALRARVAELERRGGQHSQNSSRPPSMDPPDAPPRPSQPPSGRARGGQPGHPGHHRMQLTVDAVDAVVDHYPDACPRCARGWAEYRPDVADPLRQQVWELPPARPMVTEHRYHTVACPDCGVAVTAPRPAGVPPGAFGPELAALVGLLHGRYRLSAREIAALLADVWRMPLGLGSLPALWLAVGAALAAPYEHARVAVAASPRANVDETPWKQAGATRWLWVAVGVASTVFVVAATRGKVVLAGLLGEAYAGIVGSDRFSAYKSLPLAQRQVCWAHLKRNLAEVAGWGGPSGAWGDAVLIEVDHLFDAWHRFRAGAIDRPGLQAALAPVQTAIDARLRADETELPSAKAQGLCTDLLALGPALWTFATVPAIEPTNNAAEQALRPAVLWRKGCFGADSADGNAFVARILTVAATCRQQQRDLLPFLADAVRAYWAGLPAPLLIPAQLPP